MIRKTKFCTANLEGLVVGCLISVCVLLIYQIKYVIHGSSPLPFPTTPSGSLLQAINAKGDVEVQNMDILKIISERQPNLPMEYWKFADKRKLSFNNSCAYFPKMFDVKFSNDYWQTLKTRNGTFQLLNAYYDNRTNNMFKPTIRILGMLDRIEPTMKTYCQFWFHNTTKPIITQVFEYKYLWNKKWGNYKPGIYQTYLISCKLPNNFVKVPAVVSLVEYPCNTSTVALKVIYNQVKTVKDFAVCVKGLNFPYSDLTVKLIEWIELVLTLGADKIFFYNLDVHPNVLKALSYYESKNLVHVTPHSLAGEQPNSHPLQYVYLSKKLIFKRQNEVIPYNDCFYKHMYEYRYIVLLDIDEVIIPVKNRNWKELMDLVEKQARTNKILERTSYNVRNVYFLDDLLHNHGWFQDVPKYMHMLQHVFRTQNFTKPGAYIKSFFNTNKTLALHNHFPFSCLGNCIHYPISTSLAQLQHYRRDCVKELQKICDNYRNNSVEDTTIWKYKDVLIRRVEDSLKNMGFYVEEDDDT